MYWYQSKTSRPSTIYWQVTSNCSRVSHFHDQRPHITYNVLDPEYLDFGAITYLPIVMYEFHLVSYLRYHYFSEDCNVLVSGYHKFVINIFLVIILLWLGNDHFLTMSVSWFTRGTTMYCMFCGCIAFWVIVSIFVSRYIPTINPNKFLLIKF